MTLFLQPFARYADFNGRARRAEYWQWFLFQMAVGFVLGILRITAGASGSSVVLLNALFSLAVFLPSLAVTVRRLHDSNRTGWWVLFPSAVAALMMVVFFAVAGPGLAEQFKPGATPDFAAAASGIGSFMTLVILPTLLAGLVFFIFMVLPGTTGANRFGNDPKGGMDISRIFDASEDEITKQSEDTEPYTPVFDFTSQPSAPRGLPDVPVMQTAAPALRPATGFSAPTRPVFGKRGRVS
jgi:uncharacterized membrane protein YhaH (DUF805 family)